MLLLLGTHRLSGRAAKTLSTMGRFDNVGVRKLPEDLQIRLHNALVSGEDKRGAKGTDFRVFDAWFKDAPSVFASGLSVPWRRIFPRISKEYEEQERLETKVDNKVEKKGENGGREKHVRRARGEVQLKREELSQGVKVQEDG